MRELSYSGLEAMLERSRCFGPWANRVRRFAGGLPLSLAQGLDAAALITKAGWDRYRHTSELGYGAHYVRVPAFVQFALDGVLPPMDMNGVAPAQLEDISHKVGLANIFRVWHRGMLHDGSEDGQRPEIFSAMGDPNLYPEGSPERRERSLDYVLDLEDAIIGTLLSQFPEQRKHIERCYGTGRERRLAQELLTPGFRTRSKLGAHALMTLNRMMRWVDWTTFRASADCMIVKLGDRGDNGIRQFPLSPNFSTLRATLPERMEELAGLSGTGYWEKHIAREKEYKLAQASLRLMQHPEGHINEISLANSAREYWYATNLLLMLNSRFLEPTRGDAVYGFVDSLRRRRESLSPEERASRVETTVALHRIASRAAWALSTIVAQAAEEMANFHLVYNPHIRTQSRYWATENTRPDRPQRWYERHKEDERGLTLAQATVWREWAREHVQHPETINFEERPDAQGPGFYNGLWLLHQRIDRRTKRVMDPVIGTKPPYKGKMLWPGYGANRMANIRSLIATAEIAKKLAENHLDYQRSLDQGKQEGVALYTFPKDVPGTMSRLVPRGEQE